MKNIVKSLGAGLLIAIGGTAFLSVDNKTIGALLFSVGLYAICVIKLNLFTGKVCYPNTFKDLMTILLFNMIASYGMGWAIYFMKPGLHQRAFDMCTVKLSEGLLVIPLGILCNILIFVAVEGAFHLSYHLLILAVMAFILCGFEHSIANAFYFGASGIIGWPVFRYLVLNVIGNAIGGLICRKAREGNAL